MLSIFLYTGILNFNNIENDNDISLLFLGDFMIGDSYSGSITEPFKNIKLMLENHTEIIVNLETSVTDLETISNPNKKYNYKIDNSVIAELYKNNVTILNLANNHILDFGIKGLNDTLVNLQKHNLSYFGAGNNETLARQGIIRHYNGNTKVGFLGYFEYNHLYDYTYNFYAKENISGVAELNEQNLKSDIARLKEQTDVILVSLHIGENYNVDISDNHRKFARLIIDLGADAVICHSAHIVLPVEFYKGKPIFYSIGNFIFTTPGRFDKVHEIYHVGLGVEFVISNKKIKEIKLTPFKTNNKITRYKPNFLNEKESSLLFNNIIPSEINSKIVDNSLVLDVQNINN
jgi:poly-gamma-glutamate synthesis protein (capsule biosynthesis protein)